MIDAGFKTVVRFAEPRHGVIGRLELRELGVSDHVVHRWVVAGLVHRIHRGVYAVGRPQLTPDGRRLAAALALGSTAVVSHGSAAAMWEIANPALLPIHVTLPGQCRAQRPGSGIRVHRTTTLHPDDITVLRNIPVTTVARACLDHAASPHITTARLIQVVEQSQRERRFDLAALDAVLDRNPHHPGAAKLAAVVPRLDDEPPDIASLIEGAFHEFLDERDVVRPLRPRTSCSPTSPRSRTTTKGSCASGKGSSAQIRTDRPMPGPPA